MRTQDVMTPNPATCSPETSLEDVGRAMVEHDCGILPVLDGDGHPLGVVTDRDIVCRTVAKGLDPLERTAAEAMTRPCITIGLDADLDEVVRACEEHRIRRVVVVDEDDRCCGIVTQADLARRASPDTVAELVREVSQPLEEPSLVQ